ncbi:MAG: tRNA (guanosine(37)-N1)-methyltransferase TrmD [Candidatus Wallbacteria bacterium]|nr:tRNA (guanosine(37)-N1)-methyltransferase TrmD [Candidatus Wallbacteria bacterium]
MIINILTIFPETVQSAVEYSLLGKASQNGIICFRIVNPRDFTKDRHHQVDDYPYGGGPGMLMMAPPVVEAVESIEGYDTENSELILLSPQGEVFTQALTLELSKKSQLTFICGHYEGIDERMVKILKPREISIGDYVTMGGEFPAICMIEAIARQIPGVIGDEGSFQNDSFYQKKLDCPHYTRPPEYRGESVPEVLLSGHHLKIELWRRKQALLRTRQRRPDIFGKLELTRQDLKLLEEDDDD